MRLGENIYKLRTGRKLSQEDFAAAMEVSRQSVSKWENDMAVPELEKLIKMANLFEVSLDELVGNAPPQSKQEPVAAPVSGSAQRISTEEIISIILLALAVIGPLVMVLFREWSYQPLQLALLVLPPAATVISAHLVTNHKWMFRVYVFYQLFLTVNLLYLVWGGFWFALFNWACVFYWCIKRK